MYQGQYMAASMGWWLGLGFIICLVAIALLVMLIVKLDRPWQRLDDPAVRVLDERLARGEIDAREYAQRRAALAGAR